MKNWNLVEEKRRIATQQIQNEDNFKQSMLATIEDFIVNHPSSEVAYCVTGAHPNVERERKYISPDTYVTDYYCGLYADKDGKESDCYSLNIQANCACGCGMRDRFLSVFRFSSPEYAIEIENALRKKAENSYELAQGFKEINANMEKLCKSAHLFSVHVLFGGEAYSNFAEVCNIEIPFEKGADIYRRLR